eukprot:6213608-Pleurochrysis_carterae.AAC.4
MAHALRRVVLARIRTLAPATQAETLQTLQETWSRHHRFTGYWLLWPHRLSTSAGSSKDALLDSLSRQHHMHCKQLVLQGSAP